MNHMSHMNHHHQFRKHLDGLPDAEQLLAVCRKYKTATDSFAFDLNGRLKGGGAIEPYIREVAFLKRLICAKLDRPITLYRMTSVESFSASVTEVLSGPFQYRAFMSTASESMKLADFLPSKSEQALLLKIECPPGTTFAPIDLFAGTEEDEYLLGCGTRFALTNPLKALHGPELDKLLLMSRLSSLPLLQLKVIANPPYVNPENVVQLHD